LTRERNYGNIDKQPARTGIVAHNIARQEVYRCVGEEKYYGKKFDQ
jgi:hypothetical protein